MNRQNSIMSSPAAAEVSCYWRENAFLPTAFFNGYNLVV